MLTRRDHLVLLVPLALLLLPFLIVPAASGLLASFTNYAPLEAHIRWIGFANYAALLRDSEFQASLRNIILFTTVAVPLELALGLGIALLLREPTRSRNLLRLTLLIPWLVSPIASGVMWHFLMDSDHGMFGYVLAWIGLGTLPSPLGIRELALPAVILTDIWRNTPLVSFLVLPGLLAIPAEQWEQATLDGLSMFAKIWNIVLPWLRPLLVTLALLLIGATLGSFDSILIMTGGGPGTATVTPGLVSYRDAFQINLWSLGATAAWLIGAAVLLCGVIYLRLLRAEPEYEA